MLEDLLAIGGHRWIYEDLIQRLTTADVTASAEHLGLAVSDLGEAELTFLGTTYLISNMGVRRSDGKEFKDAIGSVLIHYILKGSKCRPAGQFVTLAELAGPLFKHGSYSSSALERPIIKRFQRRIPELLAASASYGGRQGGEARSGAISLQLIFYDRDDEFPARATLLYDLNATQMIDFEVLAVLVTVFIQSLTRL
jgi:hypothetical protein